MLRITVTAGRDSALEWGHPGSSVDLKWEVKRELICSPDAAENSKKQHQQQQYLKPVLKGVSSKGWGTFPASLRPSRLPPLLPFPPSRASGPGFKAAAAAAACNSSRDVARSMPYKGGLTPCRWKGAQGQSLAAGVAVGSDGEDCLVVYTDQVSRC